MKKYLLFIFASFLLCVYSNMVYPQCIPNPNNTNLITPDTTTNFVNGTVGVPYVQDVFIHPPTDTLVTVGSLTVTAHIDSITLVTFTNIPPGLSLVCNPSSCTYYGGVSGCLSINGVPTTAGYYPLDAIIISYGSIFNGTIPITQQDTIEAYHITIGTSGIFNPSSGSFFVTQLGPNPSVSNLSFILNSSFKTVANFNVYNILGSSVMSKSADIVPGENKITIPLKSFADGVYLLNISDGKKSITRRFVVDNK